MSYGAASRRDERRKTAIERAERKAQAYKDLLARKGEPDDKKRAYQAKLDLTQAVIKNTQANIGKGTRAMQE